MEHTTPVQAAKLSRVNGALEITKLNSLMSRKLAKGASQIFWNSAQLYSAQGMLKAV
jgi:hypothetical protein